ncbi:MAG: flagellar hook-basal body complex protein [Solirubrobacteraceae bacterium]
MDVGLSIAASGMIAEQVREDQLANDLANASTPGYKPTEDVQSAFGSLLVHNSSGQTVGAMYTNTEITGQTPNLTPAGLDTTGEPLDFGVGGAGFFAVQTANGVRYTRDGQFTQSAKGDLVDANGNNVLSQTGAPIKVGADGTVPASSLGVFNVTNPVAQGDNLFSGTAAGRATGLAQSGVLESSGVDAARTMVDMIASLNTYQSGEQAIQAINETMQRSASATGALSGT